MVSAKKGDIPKLANEAASHFDVIVACGGDGTINAVATGIWKTNTPMGILPIGSGNDFSKNLDIPANFDRALQILLEGTPRAIDIGTYNGAVFVNTLGIGFDGETNRYASQTTWLPGKWKYIWAAIKTNFGMQPIPMKLSINGKTIEKELYMVTIANGKVEGGNFMVAPDASVRDGYFDVVLMEPISRWILPFYLVLFIRGNHTNLSQVQIEKATTLTIEWVGSVPIHADGEQKKMQKTLHITVHPSALSVIY